MQGKEERGTAAARPQVDEKTGLVKERVMAGRREKGGLRPHLSHAKTYRTGNRLALRGREQKAVAQGNGAKERSG